MIYPWQMSQWQFWLAQQARIGHAYLLTGVSGLGLSEFARMMAQNILCQTGNACGQCSACRQFDEANHPDFFQLEVLEGKKEIGVDQIRLLTQNLMQTAHQGGYKVAVLKQVERLNASAFNALLKTLEEPPARTLLILTSYQLNRLPATIVSRCQKIGFTPPNLEDSQAWLVEQQPGLVAAQYKRALRLNWGAPLAALAWLNQQGWEQDEAWHKAIDGIKQGRQSTNQAVADWLKWPEPSKVFDYFYLTSVQEIRRACYQQSPLNGAWFSFQQQVLQAKLDWTQNANKELLLESLTLLFLQIQSGETVILDSVFSSDLIRGTWA